MTGAVNQDELGTLVVCATRYALGRHSYIVADVAQLVKLFWPELGPNDKHTIRRDIMAELAKPVHTTFSQIDDQVWAALLTDLDGLDGRQGVFPFPESEDK